jgi:hypothetical protein
VDADASSAHSLPLVEDLQFTQTVAKRAGHVLDGVGIADPFERVQEPVAIIHPRTRLLGAQEGERVVAVANDAAIQKMQLETEDENDHAGDNGGGGLLSGLSQELG